MKSIGVLSDTHGDLHSWQKACSIWGTPELILHAGDVLSHPLSPATLYMAQRISETPVPVFISRGNCDRDGDQSLLKWPLMSPYCSIWWGGRHILLAHGDRFSELYKLVDRCKPDLVITGHTHVASLIREAGTIYLNPGSASTPRGRDPASIAIVTESEISITTLEGFQLHLEEW